ncbi:MAG: type III secretion system cytoplasmic ring protein SctQ [Verrucomicrobia bacterium]|nr:type III secretion system cytoplasmic ring protein SctQ [Verrucomicrobiota bacterium]MDE3048212.1 type III secretion system cytoplasmic ring protein SctQ [Verrucomicrobiota bacterium]
MFSWVQRIAPEVPELNTIPLFGNSPPFDWAHFSSTLASRFGISGIQIRAKDQTWLEETKIRKGLGSDLFALSIEITPLGTVYWLMSAEDRANLTSWMMRSSQKPRPPLSEFFQEGFARFITLQALDVIQEMAPFTDLTLHLNAEEKEFEKAFCLDIEIDVEGRSCWGRLVIPEELRAKWIQHFSHLSSQYVPQEIAQHTELQLSLKTGSMVLEQAEWDSIRVGDFVLLDTESYDAHKGTGMCLLMLGALPLFNAKIKQGKVELIDYAFYYEENMENTSQEGEMVALKETPVTITVEIARLKMTLDKLMHLTPGNTLELPIHPDQGVSLTVNGKRVGRAELVYLGEQLGVRILEI